MITKLSRTIKALSFRNIRNLGHKFEALAAVSALVLVAALGLQTSNTQAAANISFVKEVGSANYNSYTFARSLSIKVPATGVAAGNTVIVTAGNSSSNVVVSSVTDSRGNVYSVDVTRSSNSTSTNTNIISSYISTPLQFGDTITVNFSGQASFLMALASEWSGIAQTGRLDQKATNQGGSTALTSGTTAMTTQATELLIGSFGGSSNNNFSAGAGFTAFNTQFKDNLSSTFRDQWQEYQIVSTANTYKATATVSTSTIYAGAIATYKAATGPVDTTAPTAPANLVTASDVNTIGLSWDASSDNVAVTGYNLYLGTSKVATSTSTSYVFSGLSCGTGYSLGVEAYDAAGNVSTRTTATATTSACPPDTTAPTVSFASPTDGSTVSGQAYGVNVDASDNVAVAGVQLQLDGVNLASEMTSTPYTYSWDTTAVANGTHSLTAVARDAAGNSSTATVNINVNNVAGAPTPTPVPAANVNGITVGDGFVEASARQIIRTASNKVYVIVADDNACQNGGRGIIHVYKGTGAQAANANVPTAFAEADAANHPVSAGNANCTFSPSAVLLSPESRLDTSGTIHMAYIDGNNGSLYYQTFSTATDTWGARTVIATGTQTSSGSGWPRTGQVALTLDANNNPQVAYASSGSSNSIKFLAYSGSSWSSPATLFSGTNEMHPSMVTALDGSLHLAWLDNSLASHSVVKYAHYTAGSWSAVETVSTGDNVVLANGDDDQGPSIATDTLNRPHVLYMDGTVNGSDNYVRMRYRTSAGVWTDNTPPGGAGGASNPAGTWYSHTPQNYISASGDDWVFLGHDVNISPGGYQYQTNGAGNNWSAYATIDPRNSTNTTAGSPGLDGSASTRFDPLRDNNPGIIDLLYYDENDGTAGYPHHATVYYKAIDLGTVTPPPADTQAPTVSITSPADSTTITGSVTVAASAADNVGVVGVQFQLDGTNLGNELSVSPYSFSWDSTSAANGNHSLSAIARDAAGNTATSVINITINNTVTGGQVLLGSQTVQSQADSDIAGQAEAFKTAATASGILSKIYLYIDSGNLASQVAIGIYADNNGHPGTLLTQTSLTSPVVSAWNSVALPQLNLAAGTNYWIAILGTNGTIRFRDKSSSGNSETSFQTNLSALPATWQTGTTYLDDTLSAYGTN
jgi:hypothetical protein